MNLKTINRTIFLILITIAVYACTDKNDDCEDIFCIAIINEINIEMTDSIGNPVVLDAYEVLDLSNGNNITPDYSRFENSRLNGRYLLAVDASVPLHQSKEIQFRGTKDSSEVVRSNYIIKGGCCGVELLAGNLTLEVNP